MSLFASYGTMDLMPTSTKFSVNQKGSVLPVIVIVFAVSVCVLVSYTYLDQNSQKSSPILQIPKITLQTKVYENKDLNFRFEYPVSFEVIPDGEENYFKETGADHRKNFTGYVGYKPPEFITGIALKKASGTLLTLWVFDNPNNISIESWFDKYWYYPFLWGIFNYPDKNPLKPTVEATISGQLAKSVVVSYQPGKPEYTYVENGGKMFMFRVIKGGNEKVISQVLSSFKFIE